jgi:hypothetical protein
VAPTPGFSELCVDLLRAGLPVRFTATGPSMAPTIRDGDVITVAPARAEEIAAGEIALYAAPRGLTAHRVVARIDGPSPRFETRGDARGSFSAPIDGGRLLGRVLRVERRRSIRLSDFALPRWIAGTSLGRRLREAWSRPSRSARTPGALPDTRLDAGREGGSNPVGPRGTAR